MFFLKKMKKAKKTSKHNDVNINDYKIVDETENKKVTLAIFGKQPNDNIYAERIYSAPHMIVAGTTGSGKSVLVNSILASMMLTATPKQLRFIIIDPKAVEFSAYNDSPYMITNPITDMDKASKSLEWLVNLMQERYDKMRMMGEKGLEVPKNIEEYNDLVKNREEEEMYYTVCVVDEFSDLMGEHPEVEGYVVRIAQKARACGISLIIATQSPRANVITGLIKANIPSRICMMVVSSLESNIVLDEAGGELLRPHGDMLVKFNGSTELERCQGPYISNKSIKNMIEFSKEHYSYLNKPKDIFEDMESKEDTDDNGMFGMGMGGGMGGRHRRSPMASSYASRSTMQKENYSKGIDIDNLEKKKDYDNSSEEEKEKTEEKITSSITSSKENDNKEEKEIETNKTEENIEETFNKEEVANVKPKTKEEQKISLEEQNRRKIAEYRAEQKRYSSRKFVRNVSENADYLMTPQAVVRNNEIKRHNKEEQRLKEKQNYISKDREKIIQQQLKEREKNKEELRNKIKNADNKKEQINRNFNPSSDFKKDDSASWTEDDEEENKNRGEFL